MPYNFQQLERAHGVCLAGDFNLFIAQPDLCFACEVIDFFRFTFNQMVTEQSSLFYVTLIEKEPVSGSGIGQEMFKVIRR